MFILLTSSFLLQNNSDLCINALSPCEHSDLAVHQLKPRSKRVYTAISSDFYPNSSKIDRNQSESILSQIPSLFYQERVLRGAPWSAPERMSLFWAHLAPIWLRKPPIPPANEHEKRHNFLNSASMKTKPLHQIATNYLVRMTLLRLWLALKRARYGHISPLRSLFDPNFILSQLIYAPEMALDSPWPLYRQLLWMALEKRPKSLEIGLKNSQMTTQVRFFGCFYTFLYVFY